MQTNPLIGLNQIISPFPRVDRQHQLLISVNIFPVSDLDDVDRKLQLPYCINDSICTLTQSESIIAGQLAGARREGVCCQALNPANYLLP